MRASARWRSASGRRRRASASRSARSSAGSCSTTSRGARSSSSTSRSAWWHRRPAPGRARVARPGRAALDWAGAALSGVGLVALVWAVIEAPSNGWTSPAVLGAGRARGGRAGRLRASSSAASAEPLLDLRLFRDPRFTAASATDDGAVLRALRVPVPGDPVPAVRARLLAVGGGRARAALRGRDDRLRAALGEARRALRDQAGRDRRHAAVRGGLAVAATVTVGTGYGRLARRASC